MPTQPIEQNQPFWQLASILIVSNGLPGMAVGGVMTSQYGAGTAVVSLIVGNLILWLIGLAMISMSAEGRKQAVENIKEYLGTIAGKVTAVLLLCAFIFWIGLQLNATLRVFKEAMPEFAVSADTGFRITAAVGLFTALLSCGGIRLIKWICVICLPISVVLIVYFLVSYWQMPTFAGTWSLSLTAALGVVALNLPGYVNLPTFFRHSRSRVHSFFAISLIAIGTTLWGLTSVWTVPSSAGFILAAAPIAEASVPALIAALLLSIIGVICANLVNIYFASAGWESLFRFRWGAKEYSIVGLAGTVVFGLVQLEEWFVYFESLFTGFLACLGVILLAGYLVKLVVQHRPRTSEQLVNTLCWAFGCVVVALVQTGGGMPIGRTIVIAAVASALALLCVIFLEESIWSSRKIFQAYSATAQK